MNRNLRKACKITDKIFEECIRNFKSFKTEKDIYDFLLKRIGENSCKPAFQPIVANNSWIIHPKPRKQRLKKGFLIIDFGIKYNHHCTDMTRTIYLGKPSKKDVKLYNLILKVQEKAVNNLEPGLSCSDFHNKHVNMLGKYRKHFTHAIGHGIGKKVHQKPILSSRSMDIFERNSIVTIELGAYIKNRYGIRIEDMVLIKDKPTLLTETQRSLIMIKI